MAYIVSDADDHPSAISNVHPDILHEHILNRLDGLTLTSLSSTCSRLRSLSNVKTLWRDVCYETWPSTYHPRMQKLIDYFSDGHRGFFSDSFPVISSHHSQRSCHPSGRKTPTSKPQEIISAIDIRYDDQVIFSRVKETETGTGWFLYWPFRVDLLHPKESFPTPIETSHMEDIKLTLSWIIAIPSRNRAANFSSLRPVSVEQHWLTREIVVKYATILASNQLGSSEYVECKVMVTCGGVEGGRLHVREVCMQMEDMDGKYLNGKESLEILINSIEHGKRKKGDGREGYEEYLEMKRRRTERKTRREKIMEIAAAFGISITCAFLIFPLFIKAMKGLL